MRDSIILITIALGYSLFFLVHFIAWKNQQAVLVGENGRVGRLAGLNNQHVGGIVLLGFPLILFKADWSWLFAWPSLATGPQTGLFVPLMLLAALIAWQRAAKDVKDHHHTNSRLPLSSIAVYLMVRIIFLTTYECFFRGLLLFTSIHSQGMVWAIVINLILYTAIHILHRRDETIACIPFGVILCWLAITSQSVLPAIALHLLLAVTYEGYLLFSYSSPNMIKS